MKQGKKGKGIGGGPGMGGKGLTGEYLLCNFLMAMIVDFLRYKGISHWMSKHFSSKTMGSFLRLVLVGWSGICGSDLLPWVGCERLSPCMG